jgi:transposase InsO family protein
VIRCDNGPENISGTIQNWARDWGIQFEYIQPGKPQQNAYVERFNRTVRYEWLSQYYWSSIEEVQDFATQWMWSYNHDRPNMALGGVHPKAASGHGCITVLLLRTVEIGGITRVVQLWVRVTGGRALYFFDA